MPRIVHRSAASGRFTTAEDAAADPERHIAQRVRQVEPSGAPLWAGFDPGRLPWSGVDLLQETGHLPGGGMEAHYASAITQGAVGARDGLPWRHDIAARVAAVPEGFPVLFDMVHFDDPPDPEAHAVAVEAALGADGWAVALNEPTAHGRMCGDGQSWPHVETALRMMRAAPSLRYACCDPLHSLAPEEWWATDRLVESGLIRLVGVNYYPIHASVPLRDILREAKARYPGLPIAITETGWHNGHHRLPPGDMRLQWLAHVQQECAAAGGVRFIAWYPWLNAPCWDGTGAVWECGFPENATV